MIVVSLMPPALELWEQQTAEAEALFAIGTSLVGGSFAQSIEAPVLPQHSVCPPNGAQGSQRQPPPPQPQSAYSLHLESESSKVAALYPHANNLEVGLLVGEQWKALGAHGKKVGTVVR